MRKATQYLITVAAIGILLAFLGGCFQQQAQIPSVKQGQSGTTLTASKTATGFWERERTITYDWEIAKEATLNSDGTITYKPTATRTKTGEVDKDVYGVRGTISVTNGGAVTTENLTLADQVLYKTGAG